MEQEVRHLVSKLLNSDAGVLAVLRGICGIQISDKFRYTLTTKNIETLVPLADFAQAVERSRNFLSKTENAPFLDAYTHLDKERL